MKRRSYIGMLVAAGAVALGVLGGPDEVAAADAAKPTSTSAQPQRSGPNDNDYHANYHADYSATQNGRPASPKNTAEEPVDPRRDARRFQDGVRNVRSPYDWRR